MVRTLNYRVASSTTVVRDEGPPITWMPRIVMIVQSCRSLLMAMVRRAAGVNLHACVEVEQECCLLTRYARSSPARPCHPPSLCSNPSHNQFASCGKDGQIVLSWHLTTACCECLLGRSGEISGVMTLLALWASGATHSVRCIWSGKLTL